MADFADRSLEICYAGGSLVLFACVMAMLGLWYRSEGSVSVEMVSTPRVEAFYWAAITFSQDQGGLALSRPIASAALTVLIIALIFILPQRAGNHPQAREAAM